MNTRIASAAGSPTLAWALEGCPLIAVLRGITPPEVEAVTAEIVESGFRMVEVPLNSPDAFKSIELIARRFGDRAIVGAGTVMTVGDVARVRDAGGHLIVMPHADLAVVHAARELKMATFPGVFTPTEGFAAVEAGADGLKLFPAEAISPTVLKAWRSVFASTIPLVPSGGITPESMAGWVNAGASGFGIGGNLYKPGRDPIEIRAIAETFVNAWRSTTSR